MVGGKRQSLQRNPARLRAAVRGEGDGVNGSTHDDYFNSLLGEQEPYSQRRTHTAWSGSVVRFPPTETYVHGLRNCSCFSYDVLQGGTVP